MPDHDIRPTHEIYSDFLTTIGQIKFTYREIDVVACILHNRAVTIPSLLGIDRRAVETNIHNITRKLGCNSREGIIDFIEKSDNRDEIEKYYISLLLRSEFEKQLRHVSRLRKQNPLTCLLVYEQGENQAFLQQLKKHLIQTSINAGIRINENSLSLSQLASTFQEKESVIYILPENQEDRLSPGDTKLLQNICNQNNSLFVFLDRRPNDETFTETSNVKYVNFFSQSYYSALFEVIKKFLPDIPLEKAISAFKEKYEGIQDRARANQATAYIVTEALEDKKTHNYYKKWLKIKGNKQQGLFITLFFIIAIGLSAAFFAIKDSQKEETKQRANQDHNQPQVQDRSLVHSDLILPTDSVLLDRPVLIQDINTKLINQRGIQTIALVGPGGSGKTTLAHQYAHQQKANVIWEINAETHESLRVSFENLAQALSQTEEDKKELRRLLEIKDPIKRDESILQFVKKHLNSTPNWVLIYDNVENFSNIQDYFPQDYVTWGEGKIILTTRDSNIQNNAHINEIIHIGDLTPNQKLTLFTKIMQHGSTNPSVSLQDEKTRKFLENIPSFPLDVSVAAYYLKTTNIPYSTYLQNLIQYSKSFEPVQENLLKEAGNYTKTRYSIITLALQKLIDTHKDFTDLLLLISLLDSQNIPRDLLEKYKSQSVVDNFIYHLKKYSLITSELPSSSLKAVFSIHRSTQAIILAYLSEKLNLEKNKELLEPSLIAFKTFLADSITHENHEKMKALINHSEMFLKHNTLLSPHSRALIAANLGFIYNEFGNYSKGKRLLDESLPHLNKNSSEIAQALTYLGIIYWDHSYYTQAKDTLERALTLYKKYDPHNEVEIVVALTYLGDVYKSLGDPHKAKHSLQTSLDIYKKNPAENSLSMARAYCYLGRVYRDLGDYQQSLASFDQSLDYTPNENVSMANVLVYAGNVYRELAWIPTLNN